MKGQSLMVSTLRQLHQGDGTVMRRCVQGHPRKKWDTTIISLSFCITIVMLSYVGRLLV